MSTMIQIRNVPEKLHRLLKSRAALSGMSMSEFILQELKKALAKPTREELLEKIADLPEARLEPSSASVIRAERDRR